MLANAKVYVLFIS